MNILTGRSQEEEEAEAAALAKAKADAAPPRADADGEEPALEAKPRMVELRYGSYQGLQLSAAEVRRIKAEECKELLARRKLSLVLDLDHTLLNSALYGELDQAQGERLEAWKAGQGGADEASTLGSAGGDGDGKVSEEEAMRQSQLAQQLARDEEAKKELECQLARRERGEGGGGGGGEGEDAGPFGAAAAAAASSESGGEGSVVVVDRSDKGELLYHLRHIAMWTKLRPYVREFLLSASKMYELYVYTMGARAYASEMVALLDPDGSLGLRQSDRVIGKEDSTLSTTKNLDVILGSDRTTLIVDDTPAVWPNHAAQVLVPKRYHYFPASAARFHDGMSHLASGEDEASDQGQLAALLHALTDVHAHYFGTLLPSSGPDGHANPPHVSKSVRAVRRRVLDGCCIVFSHVIPLEQQARPESHSAWQLAHELGARVEGKVGPKATHVVVGRDPQGNIATQTDKVRWARAHDVHAVTIDWLTRCGYMWRWVGEEEEGMAIPNPASSSASTAVAASLSNKAKEPSSQMPPPESSS